MHETGNLRGFGKGRNFDTKKKCTKHLLFYTTNRYKAIKTPHCNPSIAPNPTAHRHEHH
jgi:hypothetical protein